MSYSRDVWALARKDLLLELRARDTVPAMLLFVVSALVVFHFALPSGSSPKAADGLLWVAIVFTALLGLGRAFVPEREQHVLDGLVLAPCDRSAIWLAKGVATLAFLVLAELVALPAFAVFFSGLRGSTIAAVALANEVKVRTAARLVERGAMPPVITSAAVVGAEESARLFDAAYAEHARRAARALQGARHYPNEGGGSSSL